MDTPTLFLTVGLPGAGKTTRACELAERHRILRLTPDDWLIPLFAHSGAADLRDILEGRLVWVAHEVLVSGASVVLDFGCWSAQERWAVRAVAELAGARFSIQYVAVPEAVRRARCDRRWTEAPDTTVEMTPSNHDRWVSLFEPPTSAETSYGELPAAPDGMTWPQWASRRWPTLPRLDAP